MKASKTQNLANNQRMPQYSIGVAIPFSIYSSLGLHKVFRYIASRENLNYDLNSVVRFLVCVNFLNIDRKQAAISFKDEYLFKNDFSEAEISTTIDILYKYKKTILRSLNNNSKKIGIPYKENYDICYLLNNCLEIKNVYKKISTQRGKDTINELSYTTLETSIYDIVKDIIFSRSCFDEENNNAILDQSDNNHVCIIGDIDDININKLSKMTEIGHTFCLRIPLNHSIITDKLYNWMINDKSAEHPFADGIIKKTQVLYNMYYKNKIAEWDLRFVCFRSENFAKYGKSNDNTTDNFGWTCFISNEKQASDEFIVLSWYSLRLAQKLFNLSQYDFFGRLLLTNSLDKIEGYFVVQAILQTVIQIAQNYIGFPYNNKTVVDELQNYVVLQVDKDSFILPYQSELGDKIFTILNIKPKTHLNKREINSYFSVSKSKNRIKKIIKKSYLRYSHDKWKFN